MLQNIKKRTEGFTIIEVLIVLAIAALILLIVFLAVPALQRNSRNTQRKNDVSALLGAVSEFGNNNSGVLPDIAPTQPNGKSTVQLNGSGSPTPTPSEAKVGYYNKGIGTGLGDVTLTTTATNAAFAGNVDYVQLVMGAKCSTTTTGATVPGSTRQIAAQYQIESTSSNAGSSNGLSPTCQNS